MIKTFLKQREWINTKENFLNKKEVKERLNIILNILESNEVLSTENIKNIRTEIYKINQIKKRTSIFSKKEMSEYITIETFNLLRIRLKSKPIEYKKYITEVFESLL